MLTFWTMVTGSIIAPLLLLILLPSDIAIPSLAVLLCIFGIMIYAAWFFLNAKYLEYKANYIMFYSVEYLMEYSVKNNINVEEIPAEAVEGIVESVFKSTYFDKKDIEKGPYFYYHRILNVYPGWLSEEIEKVQ